MKKFSCIPLILIAILAIHPLFYSCGEKAIGADKTIIAEFEWDGKHQITLEEMMHEISELPKYKQRQYQDKAGLEEYMLLMAESRLILCLAKDMALNEDTEILKKVKNYLHDLMIEKLTAQEVDAKLVLTEADYKGYYEENKADYVRPEQVRLLCITLQNKERADEIFAEIKAGKDIAVAVQELSDRGELVGPGANPAAPGDTDYISRNSYPPGTEPFMEAAFSAEINTIHDGVIAVEVQGQKYYMIFRKEEARAEYQRPFDEADVRKDVEKRVKRQTRDTLMKEWVSRLREQAEVKTYIDRIPEDEPTETEEETPPEQTQPAE